MLCFYATVPCFLQELILYAELWLSWMITPNWSVRLDYNIIHTNIIFGLGIKLDQVLKKKSLLLVYLYCLEIPASQISVKRSVAEQILQLQIMYLGLNCSLMCYLWVKHDGLQLLTWSYDPSSHAGMCHVHNVVHNVVHSWDNVFFQASSQRVETN